MELIPEELHGVKVVLGEGRATSSAPIYSTKAEAQNGTKDTQEIKLIFSRKASVTSTVQHETGFAFELSVGLDGKLGPVNVKSEAKASTENKVTYGKEESTQDTRAYEFPVKVAPETTVIAEAIVQMTKMDIPYTVTGTSRVSEKTITSTGTWTKVEAGQITYKIVEKRNSVDPQNKGHYKQTEG